MNRRILLSLGGVAFIGALAAGATGAFFTSTQASTGNTFAAGSIAFTVDSKAEYDGSTCVNGTWSQNSTGFPTGNCNESWTATALGVNNQFFDYTDIKPQDQGENTISLHNTGNPAWACMAIDLTQNSLTSSNDIPFDGFLGDEIQVFMWRDTGADGVTPGDNLYEPSDGDVAITPTPESINSLYGTGSTTEPETVNIPLIDSTHGGNTPLPGGADSYIGVAWCAGTLTVDSNGNFTCNGASMGNEAQNNSLMANITLMESQSRNQPDYECPTGVTADTSPGTKVGANLDAYVPPSVESCNITVNSEVSPDSTHATTINGGIALATPGQTVCVAPGTYDETVDLDQGVTLASTDGPGDTTIDGGVNLTAGSSAIEGFKIIPGTFSSVTDGIFLAGGLSSVNIDSNNIDGTTVSGARGIETTYGASYPSGITINNNSIHNLLTGIYTNPHTGNPFLITDDDFADNTSGIGGVTNSTVENNQFTGTSAGEEAMGADTTYSSGSTIISTNNFLNGSKINTYSSGTVTAPNNFFNLTGTTQESGETVNFTPEAASQYAHN